MTITAPIACVRLPALPIVAHHRRDAAPPSERRGGVDADTDPAPRTVHRGRGTQARVAWCDGAARAAGVRPGITLAAARARSATLWSVEEDARRMTEARREVVRRLLAVSPRVAADGPCRFWVEPIRAIGEEAGMAAWCGRARAVLQGLGEVSVGVGPTAAIAWAAACACTDGHRVVEAAEAARFLDAQPLELLEIEGEALDVLAALGIRSAGALRGLDPVSLGMRFGPAVADARRRLDGLDARRPATPRLEDALEVRVDLDDPIESVEPLSFLLSPSCERLASMLRARGEGVVCLRLILGLRAHLDHLVEVRTASPLADGRAAVELLRTALERASLDAPLVSFRLVAAETAPLDARSGDLFRGGGRDRAAQEVALSRLRARLGGEAVRRAAPHAVGSLLARARFVESRDGLRADAATRTPLRRVDPAVPVEGGFARVAGRCRRLIRLGRVERVDGPWWEEGRRRVELVAWAEMDGPLLVMLRAVCDTDCHDRWEVVAWVD